MDDVNPILREYRDAVRSRPDPASLLSLVRRYNLPWFGPPNILGGRTHEIKLSRPGLQPATTPVLCYESFLKGDERNDVLLRVRSMAALPQFYRLNWIRQLSTTSLSISLDGNHNRLSHSLGTLDIASYFTRVLADRLKPIEVKAILVYAFIHDSFHGPMGHAMDLIKDVIWGARVQERIDKHLLLVHVDRALNKAGFLWRAVRDRVADNDTECLAIFEHIDTFLAGDARDKAYMAEIVDGDLDADRIDYIWRDHIHLMMNGPNVTFREIEDVIDSARVVEEPKGENHLRFSLEYAEPIERVLNLRVWLYRRFYEHPIKVVADEMLTHAVYYVLKGEGILTREGELRSEPVGFAEQFSYLTDDGLFHFLGDVTSKEAHIIPHALLHDLRANRLFEVVDRRGLKRQNFPALTRRCIALDHELEAIQRKEADTIRSYLQKRSAGIFNRGQHAAIIARYNEVATQNFVLTDGDNVLVRQDPEWQGVMLPYTPEDDIYRIQLLYGGGFRKKVLLERLLWQQLQRREGSKAKVDDALVRMSLAFAGNRDGDKVFTEWILSLLRETPLVFINLSWIPGITDRDLTKHKLGYSRDGLRFHDNGRPVSMEPELDVNSREDDYCITICAPTILLRSDGMREIIRDCFVEFLSGRTWILPDALEVD